MKGYAPRKVFVLENGEYIELTNEEFEHRKVTDRTHYADFSRDKERQRYLKKLDEIHGLLSIDAVDNEDDNGTGYIQIETDDVADTVAHALLIEKFRSVIYMQTQPNGCGCIAISIIAEGSSLKAGQLYRCMFIKETTAFVDGCRFIL